MDNLTEIQKVELERNLRKASNRLLRTLAKIVLDFNITIHPVFYMGDDESNIQRYMGSWCKFISTEEDKLNARQLLENLNQPVNPVERVAKAAKK